MEYYKDAQNIKYKYILRNGRIIKKQIKKKL